MPAMRVKELRYVKASDLRDDERNWRKHPKAQRQQLQAMLDAVGIVSAVLARETPEGLVVVDGHLRKDMLGDEELPVLIVDLDEEEAGQVLATLDPIASMAQARVEALRQLHTATRPAVDWDVLMGSIRPEKPEGSALSQGTRGPAPREELRTKPGDLWTLGKHRLLCGDSTNPDHVARLLDGATPFLILTDPPYSSGGFQETGKRRGSSTAASGWGATTLANDMRSTRGYRALMGLVFDQVTETALAYVFTDWKMWIELYDVLEAKALGVRNMLVWDKLSPALGKGWRAQHELIMVGVRRANLWAGMSGAGNVLNIQREIAPLKEHPTQKPVALFDALLQNTPPGAVYDPFLGAGTTIISAERHGRTCYGMEVEPAYVDATVQRWETATGKKAVRHDKSDTPHTRAVRGRIPA